MTPELEAELRAWVNSFGDMGAEDFDRLLAIVGRAVTQAKTQ